MQPCVWGSAPRTLVFCIKVIRFDTLVGAEAELEKATERGERAYILRPLRNKGRGADARRDGRAMPTAGVASCRLYQLHPRDSEIARIREPGDGWSATTSIVPQANAGVRGTSAGPVLR
jgi:hypothetical protein